MASNVQDNARHTNTQYPALPKVFSVSLTLRPGNQRLPDGVTILSTKIKTDQKNGQKEPEEKIIHKI